MKWAMLAALPLLLLAGCGTAAHGAAPASTILWPAPKDPLTLIRKAGLVAERHETLIHHVHAHLDVFVNGQAVRVPAGIGINIHDPGVQHGETSLGMAYGGISMCRRPCISPLHTHDATGVLHTESASAVPNRLGQFFIEWNVRLNAHCVDGYCAPKTPIAIYVDGKRYRGDPTRIPLLNMREIAVVIGRPPSSIPHSFPSP